MLKRTGRLISIALKTGQMENFPKMQTETSFLHLRPRDGQRLWPIFSVVGKQMPLQTLLVLSLKMMQMNLIP
jgi:hypothetical protein